MAPHDAYKVALIHGALYIVVLICTYFLPFSLYRVAYLRAYWENSSLTGDGVNAEWDLMMAAMFKPSPLQDNEDTRRCSRPLAEAK